MPKRFPDVVAYYKECSEEELKKDYLMYLDIPSNEAPLIKLVAELRGFDVSNW